jgi:hypothetical protein
VAAGKLPQFRRGVADGPDFGAPATCRYDSSLAPALDWDGQNSSREQGEQLNAGSSQIFNICGLPDMKVHKRNGRSLKRKD